MTIAKGANASKYSTAFLYAAAAAVAIAGILHLMLAPGNFRFNVNQGILFAIGGIVQIFWIIPVLRRWGLAWYSIGIAGNVAFVAIWLITRFPGNPITGRGEMEANTIELITEAAQLAFIGLATAILFIDRKRSRIESSHNDASLEQHKAMTMTTTAAQTSRTHGRKGLMILGAIVIALILVSWFVLPSLMPRRGRGGEGFREGGERSGQRAGLQSSSSSPALDLGNRPPLTAPPLPPQ